MFAIIPRFVRWLNSLTPNQKWIIRLTVSMLVQLLVALLH